MAHMSLVSQTKRPAMPSEAEIFERLQAGETATEIAAARGVCRECVVDYIARRRSIWAERPPVRVKPDDRKIVVQRLVYENEAYRLVDISLPRVTMHVRQISEARQ